MKNRKVLKIIEIILIASAALFVISATLFQLIAPENAFSKWCIENVWDVKNIFTSFKNAFSGAIN